MSQASAQGYLNRIEHYSVPEGLSHREVNAIFKDRQGFVWVAAKYGLNRFDGYDFKWYTRASTGYDFDNIYKIIQDDERWLWLFKGSGLLSSSQVQDIVLFHPETGEIQTFIEKFGETYDFDWNESVATPMPFQGGVCFAYVNKGKIVIYKPRQGFKLIDIVDAKEVRLPTFALGDNIWAVLGQKRLAEYDSTGLLLREISVASHPFLHPNQFWAWKGGLLFLAYKQKKRAFDFFFVEKGTEAKKLNKDKLLGKNWITNDWRIAYDPLQDAFWIPSDKEFQILKTGREELVQNPENEVWGRELLDRAWFLESKGRVWTGGHFGFNIINIQKNKFTKYFYTKNNNNRGKAIRGIYIEDSILYTCLENESVASIDLHTQPESNSPFSKIKGKYSKEGKSLWGKGDGSLWLGSWHFSHIDLQAFELIKTYKFTGIEKEIWAIYNINRGHFLMGLSNGLAEYREGSSSLLPFSAYNKFSELSRAFILHIAQDKAATIWICSSTGLYIFDPDKGITARYWTGGEGRYHLPSDNIQHFHEDAEGIFWLATGGGGLIRWDRKSGTTKQLTRVDGLSNNTIYAVYEDKHNKLWMSSDYGIMQMDKTSFRINTFLTTNGISHNEFNRISHLQDKDGRIYFGGLNGITAFHPDSFLVEVEHEDAILQLTLFEQFDGEENRLIDRTLELMQSHEIVMQPDDRFFRIEFSLLTYDKVDKIQYAYKVEGVDQDWRYQSERSLRMSRMPYGKHTLIIKGQAADGRWSSNQLNFQINVLKPFYLKTWFLIGLIMFFLVLGPLLFLQRTRLLKARQTELEATVASRTEELKQDKEIIEKQAAELQQLDKMKSRFFANVSHELRTPLTLMLGPVSSILKKGVVDQQDSARLMKVKQSGKSLLKLIGSILDLSKMESGKMQLYEETVLFFPFLRRLSTSFASEAERGGIKFVFNYQLKKDLIVKLDKDKLEIIFNNLLSNALKFTPAEGRIIVKIENLNDAIQVSVSDTGRGIHPDDLPHIFDRFYQSNQPDAATEGGTGIGLALSQEFVKLMGGEIKAKSILGEGTTFSFFFPLKESQEKILETATEPFVQKKKTKSTQVAPQLDKSAATVLLVEDNHNLREYIQSILEVYYKVIPAENGKIALDKLAQNPDCQLVLSDIMMPIMDGYQLLTKLKSDSRYRHLPIIMLTARADMQDKLKALRIGVDDYLLKPFEEDELLARIANLLQNAQQRQVFVEEEKQLEPSQTLEMSAEDEAWIQKIEVFILANLSDSRFSIDFLAEEIGMGRRQLQRTLKKAVGLSPNAYINQVRLHQARQLLESGQVKYIKKLSAELGFASEVYFSRQFKKQFGKLPSEY